MNEIAPTRQLNRSVASLSLIHLMFTDETSQGDALQSSFSEMRDTGWNPDEDLLWGYFFIDVDPEKFGPLVTRLKQMGFAFVGISELTDDRDEPSGTHMLHVEKVETHGPVSLAKRNVEFAQLAVEFDVLAYDGWDAGKVPSVN